MPRSDTISNPTFFVRRNHTYEVPQVGYHRTVPIEAYDDSTFVDKKHGTRGWLMLEPNCKVLMSIEAFFDDDKIGVFVEKYDTLGKIKPGFNIIITRADLLKVIEKPQTKW